MRQRITGLTETIRGLLKEAQGKPLSLMEIYEGVHHRLDITSEQEEVTYGQPNWHHSVRRILTELVREGEVIRVDTGVYRMG